MQVTFELTQRDFLDAFAAHRNRNMLSRWSFRVVLCIEVLILAACVFLFVTKPTAETFSSTAPIAALAIVWGLFMFASPWWSARTQFSKQPSAHGPRTLQSDDIGLHWRWNGGSADVEWRNILRCIEGKSQFLLYTSPACFNMVPKRAFSEQELTAFRSLLREHVNKATHR